MKTKIGKTWIVLDHNGEKPIYDVKKWIPAHLEDVYTKRVLI